MTVGNWFFNASDSLELWPVEGLSISAFTYCNSMANAVTIILSCLVFSCTVIAWTAEGRRFKSWFGHLSIVGMLLN